MEHYYSKAPPLTQVQYYQPVTQEDYFSLEAPRQCPGLANCPISTPDGLTSEAGTPAGDFMDVLWLENDYQTNVQFAQPASNGAYYFARSATDTGVHTNYVSARKRSDVTVEGSSNTRKRTRRPRSGKPKCQRTILDKKKPDVSGFVNYDANDRDAIMTAVAPSGNTRSRKSGKRATSSRK